MAPSREAGEGVDETEEGNRLANAGDGAKAGKPEGRRALRKSSNVDKDGVDGEGPSDGEIGVAAVAVPGASGTKCRSGTGGRAANAFSISTLTCRLCVAAAGPAARSNGLNSGSWKLVKDGNEPFGAS